MSAAVTRVSEFEYLLGAPATAADLRLFASSVERDGRRLVVGAVIHDGTGRVYVQRRSRERALFPGCWDLVGGHGDPGEGVLEALARELLEETGWGLEEAQEVLEVVDWSAGGEDKREIDLLVTASGDLARPRLEPGKHDLGHWLSAGELEVLDQPGSDGFVRGLVEAAFAVLDARRDRAR